MVGRFGSEILMVTTVRMCSSTILVTRIGGRAHTKVPVSPGLGGAIPQVSAKYGTAGHSGLADSRVLIETRFCSTIRVTTTGGLARTMATSWCGVSRAIRWDLGME